jgi:hypothetical protein
MSLADAMKLGLDTDTIFGWRDKAWKKASNAME